MLQQYLFAGLVIILGYLVITGLRRKEEKKKKKHERTLDVTRGKPTRQRGECNTETVSNGDADIIIVGAGVAGSALACVLGRDRWRVHVVERNLTQPDRIVGEFLQPGGHLKLIELGLGDCVEEIDAQEEFGFVIYKDGRVTEALYPLKNFKFNVSARSFHNGRFIQRMREKAAKLPNVHLEQGTVTSLLEENGIVKGVEYKTKLGKELKSHAPLTIVCDGCFSNLRHFLCSSKVELLSCSVGLILEDCQLPCPNFCHVVIGDPSVILLYQISSSEIRCLVDIPGTMPSIANGGMSVYLKTVVAPQIPDELRNGFLLAIDRDNIRTMPNKSMATSPSSYQGAVLLGDALNIRHSFAGGGMTVALSDIAILRDLLMSLDDLHDSIAVQKQLNVFYITRKPTACVVNAIAAIGHKLFNPSLGKVRNEMVRVSLEYIALANATSEESMALLAGIDIQPLGILVHVNRIIVYAISCLLFPYPSPKKLWMGAKLTLVVCTIIFPIMVQERAWEMFFPTRILT